MGRARHSKRLHARRDLASAHDLRGRLQIGQPAIGARADECESIGVPAIGLTRRAGPYRPRARSVIVAPPASAKADGAGIDLVDRDDILRRVTPGDLRPQRRAVDIHHPIVLGIGRFVEQRAPVRRQPGPTARPSVPSAAVQVLERRVVGGDEAAARAELDRHVADRQSALHRQRADGRTGVFDHVADAGIDAILADQSQDHVLGIDALAGRAVKLGAQRARLAHDQRSGWRTPASPRWCRCPRPMRRHRRSSQCGCRHRRRCSLAARSRDAGRPRARCHGWCRSILNSVTPNSSQFRCIARLRGRLP